MAGLNALDERVWTAHGDAWQAEGRLREPVGGGAAELPGIRLMASGLPHAQWNNGDVTDPALVDVKHVRAWYAARARGSGVPWGVCVPSNQVFKFGRLHFRKRCMGLTPDVFRRVDPARQIGIGEAMLADIDSIVHIDAAAFGDPAAQVRPWIEPHLGAAGFIVALARLDGVPVGIATAIVTEGRAGSCVGIFGVGVLEHTRRRGIGSAMTSWLLERAFADGAALAHLNPDSDVAAQLYARMGFIETAGLDVHTDL
jgi:GNAT superfamily N-acetyltransferase